ncbi:hypothetical protein FCJ57_22350 [Burkholderia diffusa]|nr:hypothetical protein [Burkholderia diffusa]
MVAAECFGRHATGRYAASGKCIAVSASRSAYGFSRRMHASHAKFAAQQYAGVERLRTVHRVIP